MEEGHESGKWAVIMVKPAWAQTRPGFAVLVFTHSRNWEKNVESARLALGERIGENGLENQGAGSLESRPRKQKLCERSRNWAMNVESGLGREKVESEGRREEGEM